MKAFNDNALRVHRSMLSWRAQEHVSVKVCVHGRPATLIVRLGLYRLSHVFVGATKQLKQLSHTDLTGKTPLHAFELLMFQALKHDNLYLVS